MSIRYTFSNWLAQQAKRDDPIGDLARDAAQDPNIPRGAFRINTWRKYLQSQGACPEALDALKEAFKEFAQSPKAGL